MSTTALTPSSEVASRVATTTETRARWAANAAANARRADEAMVVANADNAIRELRLTLADKPDGEPGKYAALVEPLIGIVQAADEALLDLARDGEAL